MKKIIFTLSTVVLTTIAFGQITKPDSTKKEFKNIVELDVTGLLHQFFSSGTGGFYFNTPYMISYKRIFKNNAIRFGVGGTLSNRNSKENDTINNSSKNNSFNVGLGIEHYCYLAKRWNFFFGIDAIVNYSQSNYQQGNSSTNFYKQEQTNYGYGVSPLIGIQFKINSRMSVSTETSYDIVNNISDDKRTESQNPQYNSNTKSHGIQSTFNAPININFRIHF